MEKMGNKTRTKLFGTISVSDMANSNYLDTNGIEGYRIDHKLRFNFPNKDFKISAAKSKRYLDVLMEKKKLIPAPSKYAD